MSCILSIDTSTNVCSVAVSHDGCCVFDKEEHSGPNHAEKLGTFVDEALSFIDDNNLHLDAVAVKWWSRLLHGLTHRSIHGKRYMLWS